MSAPTISPETNVHATAMGEPSRGINDRLGHTPTDTHRTHVGPVPCSPATKDAPTSSVAPSQVPPSPADRSASDAHSRNVGRGRATEGDHRPYDNQSSTVALGPILRDPLLSIMADAVDDLEGVRIAMENRYRQLTRAVEDSDGELRGFGLTDDVAEVKRVRAVVDGLIDLEHKSVLNLQRQVRTHPLWIHFAKNALGVGEKQFARLLAVIGDPYWNDLHDRPRLVSELRSYCGWGDAERQRRRKGQKSNWSDDARKRTWLIASACLKAQGHYSEVYYAAREKYREATHSVDCVRCGPAGKPALAGSPLSLAHQHNRGLRAIAKELLRDLWKAARDIHQAAA